MTRTTSRFQGLAGLKPSDVLDIQTAETAQHDDFIESEATVTFDGSLGVRRTHDDGLTSLLHRVRGEYLEMPGLRLSPAQAARLWAVDRSTAERLLDGLTSAGFLLRTQEGHYLRASMV